MKLTIAHLVLLVMAISLLEFGHQSLELAFSKAGGLALLASATLLLIDLTLGAAESFRKEALI
ncbi:hypothetical protein IFT48_03110 [Pseudomonas fluorescens]|uniref:hypothetical protein n=1 Tax=Pseudomonas TaxID=286 RepID=UPI000F030035|nr:MULTISPECIES: hypothetical protein [Pseudomonas]MBD8088957.1 hypothetical protein [Pseudomonas fluorescens]MBD8615608.1 hypothetical protein [Pseudomonas putida]MBD8681740.1 hypothetical protein [Pseudomonas sp. CFBP 13719]